MLSKPPVPRFVPAEKGRPAIPYRAAYTACGASPAQGYWRQSCSSGRMQAPTNGSIQLPQNADITGYEKVGDVTYVRYTICRSYFVQTSPPGPVMCTNYPEQRAEPAVPPIGASVAYDNVFAWDAGANSEDELEGDVTMTLRMEKVVGVVVGLAAGRAQELQDLNRLTHALYFHQSEGGRMQVCAMEAGRRVSATRLYLPSDAWEVRRVGGVVGYFQNGDLFFRSLQRSHGPVLVGCAMYATGDAIE